MKPRSGYPEIETVRTLQVTRTDPSAKCWLCDWSRIEQEGSMWAAVRAAARRHTRTTGHDVWCGSRVHYLYGRRDG